MGGLLRFFEGPTLQSGSDIRHQECNEIEGHTLKSGLGLTALLPSYKSENRFISRIKCI